MDSKSKAKEEILAIVKDIVKIHPGGEAFFDALDEHIIGQPNGEIFKALYELVDPNDTLILSGGFGKYVADSIDAGKFRSQSYILFNGGIRKAKEPTILRRFGPNTHFATFLDDTVFGGATYHTIQSYINSEDWETQGLYMPFLTKCVAVYDGCPIKRYDVVSVFRYYDYFPEAQSNFKFAEA